MKHLLLYFSVFFLSINAEHILAQSNISGIVNHYTRVTAFSSATTLTVSTATGFKAGDTVMIFQAKGLVFNPDDPYTVAFEKDAGKYEITVINQIGGSSIEFTSPLLNTYDALESVQLIRVPSYGNAYVTNLLTCAPWNKATQTGGVLVMIVDGTLELNADIDVSGKGFIRGLPYTSPGNCLASIEPFYLNILNIHPDSTSGKKGEGAITNTNPFAMGNNPAANGGGAGVGQFSGGAGGGNYGGGGHGAKESCAGDPDPNWGGWGGIIDFQFFQNSEKRLFLGGGGGSGIQKTASSGSAGGNGGGIVIILAPHLKTNGYSIKANGEDVAALVSDGSSAGGGGGGGMVLLSIDSVKNNLNVSVKGGNGGSTAPSNCTGQGGGGGGGFVWHSGLNLSFSSLILAGGLTGLSAGCLNISSTNGTPGDSLNKLNLPLTGFLFNIIKGDQNICYNTKPQKLTATQPKGGDGNFAFLWQSRVGATAWSDAVGINNLKEYTPGFLTDTTHFRRVVSSAGISDTSKVVTVNVFPQITNNILAPDSIICYGSPALKIRGSAPAGGKGGFTYLWAQRTLAGSWLPISGETNVDLLNTSNTITQFYRRQVTSLYCSTYDSVKVEVLPLISNNIIAPRQTICYNAKPVAFVGNTPVGGDNVYKYVWQRSTDSLAWVKAGVSTGNFSNPPALTQTTFYRRLVLSGLRDCCKDTSKNIKIVVLPKILSNTISGAQTICEATKPDAFNGSLPSGGDNNFRYQWESSKNTVLWDSLSTNTGLQNYSYDTLNTTRYFRRIVRSGLLDCCKDTSADIKITVQPKIKNNIISANQTICQNSVPLPIVSSGGGLAGGNGSTYAIKWLRKPTSGAFSDAPGANNLLAYQSPPLNDTALFTRSVVSGSCRDTSNRITVVVLKSLAGNIINGNPEVCNGLPAQIITGGNMSGGEPGDYKYSWTKSISGTSGWGNIAGESAKDLIPGILPSNLYFKRIVKSGLNDCCIDSSNSFKIAINALPVASLKSYDSTICFGNKIPLKLTLSSGNAPYNVVYSDGTAQTTINGLNIGTSQFVYEPQRSSPISIYSVTDSKGCLAVVKPGVVNLVGFTVPKANPGISEELCGLNYQLKAIASIGKRKWSAPGFMFSPADTLANASIIAPSYGNHVLKWKEINGICSDSAEITLTFFEQPVNPYAGKDTTLTYNFKTQLTAALPSVGNGVWSTSSDATIANTNSSITDVTNLKFGKYTFYWTITNGVCPLVIDSVLVTLNDLGRYTGFSPNDDGVNDKFVVDGLENAGKKTLKIANRWGIEVFSSPDYQNDWDGKNSNGEPLPEDTYYYILKVDNFAPYKGFVVLKR